VDFGDSLSLSTYFPLALNEMACCICTACTDRTPTISDLLTTSDLVAVPMAAQALVIVFNLGTLKSLILTPNITSQIFLGTIQLLVTPPLISLSTITQCNVIN
jgi:hypothetical protein